jgi:hypothetical protein
MFAALHSGAKVPKCYVEILRSVAFGLCIIN